MIRLLTLQSDILHELKKLTLKLKDDLYLKGYDVEIIEGYNLSLKNSEIKSVINLQVLDIQGVVIEEDSNLELKDSELNNIYWEPINIKETMTEVKLSLQPCKLNDKDKLTNDIIEMIEEARQCEGNI